jgi:hypothetical protein
MQEHVQTPDFFPYWGLKIKTIPQDVITEYLAPYKGKSTYRLSEEQQAEQRKLIFDKIHPLLFSQIHDAISFVNEIPNYTLWTELELKLNLFEFTPKAADENPANKGLKIIKDHSEYISLTLKLDRKFKLKKLFLGYGNLKVDVSTADINFFNNRPDTVELMLADSLSFWALLENRGAYISLLHNFIFCNNMQ